MTEEKQSHLSWKCNKEFLIWDPVYEYWRPPLKASRLSMDSLLKIGEKNYQNLLRDET